MSSYEETYVGKPQRALAYRNASRAEHVRNGHKDSPFVISVPMQVRALMKRRVHVLKGNKLTVVANFLCVTPLRDV